ncbi:hypothetical protein [uncultured Jannaschia sp.]|nr:hypothetical protein [uncultured Jannaschia sp.]
MAARIYARYCKTEVRLGYTFGMSGKPLPEVTGLEPDITLLRKAA